MTDFTIPDEAVEPIAKQICIAYDWSWDDPDTDHALCERIARAAILAAIKAWPGMQRRPSGAYYAIVTAAHLVLPLPDEGAPRQGDACNET